MPDQALRTHGFFVLRFTREHFYARATEWFAGALLVLTGVGLVLQPTLFTLNPVFEIMAAWAGQGSWAVLMLVVGLTRLTALVINGAWRRSPHLRALTAFLGCGVWFMLAITMAQLQLPNLGVALYPAFVVLDAFNVYRAMGDAGAADTRARVDT